MKALFLAALAALSVSAAQADTIANKLEYRFFGGTYLDMYTNGDRGTFQNTHIVEDYETMLGPGTGPGRQFANEWIFDLANTASVTLTVNSRGTLEYEPGTEPRFIVLLYLDAGSECAFLCTVAIPPDPDAWLLFGDQPRQYRGTVTLSPGRYLIRIIGGTRLAGESGYTATLSVR